MAHMTLTISTQAYARLKKNKLPGESFSEVILREMPDPCDTAGELLERLKGMDLPKPDPKVVKAFKDGRGRRSNRPVAQAA